MWTRKQPRAPPAGADQVTETVDLTTGEINDDSGASGEIEDDGGVSGNRGSTGKTPAQPKGEQPIPRGFGFSSSDEDNEDDEGDDDLEDSKEAEIADELLEEDTRRALSQSRSEARRRSHATPSRHPIGGSGGPPGGSGDSDDDDLGAAQQAVLAAITLDLQDPCPVVQDLRHRASIHPDLLGPEPDLPCPVARVALKAALRPDRLLLSPKSTPAPDLLPESPFGPDSGVIPGRLLPRQLDATAVAPWAAEKLNRVTIVAMKIGSLFPDLPLKTGRIFPHEGEDVPLSDYHDDLVTQPQVESLMAAKPWEILSTNSGSAISFHTDVGGRFGLFLGAYRQFETKHRMALWEGTHKFPISRPKLAKSPWLADFKKKNVGIAAATQQPIGRRSS
ncbi:hypothetical protein PC110_g17224 [Phytophthora cactorum]|uniref:Uncharacterized protein n=1 Tax=Phytophthora cactorum TaxID=29920 RepID=A0A329RQ88_9STRA|nr:hypothetical protein PC110_g17224 [Phytophthora cactorum]